MARWDNEKKQIVVIGSGIGGLASAALFAKLGHRVRVLEAHREIGGHARSLRYQGLRYCVGPQYVWNFNDGDIGDRFLKFLGIEEISPFQLMDHNGFETVFVGDDNRDLPGGPLAISMGLERFQTSMIERFPEDRKGLVDIFRDLQGMVAAVDYFRNSYINKPNHLGAALDLALTRDLPMRDKVNLVRGTRLSLGKWFSRYNISRMCRKVLYAHGGVFAENEDDLSAVIYVFLTGKYHSGARLPSKGFDGFMEAIRYAIEREGGRVETQKRVVRLETNHQGVSHVECKDGTTLACDAVFSDVSPRITDGLLLQAHRRKMDYRPSNSLIMVCIGLVGRHELVAKMRGRNYWWQTAGQVEFSRPDVTKRPTMLYVASHTANGYGNSEENELDDGLTVGLPGNYDQEKRIYEKGADAVDAFKKKLGDDVLAILDENMVPGIKEQLRFIEVVSSVDTNREIGAERGNAYGRRLVADYVTGVFPKHRRLDNIWNVSATENVAGIASGIETAAVLMNRLTGERF